MSEESFFAHGSKTSAFSLLGRQFVSAFLRSVLPELAWLLLTASIPHCTAGCCLLPGSISHLESPADSLDPAIPKPYALAHVLCGP